MTLNLGFYCTRPTQERIILYTQHNGGHAPMIYNGVLTFLNDTETVKVLGTVFRYNTFQLLALYYINNVVQRVEYTIILITQ